MCKIKNVIFHWNLTQNDLAVFKKYLKVSKVIRISLFVIKCTLSRF